MSTSRRLIFTRKLLLFGENVSSRYGRNCFIAIALLGVCVLFTCHQQAPSTLLYSLACMLSQIFDELYFKVVLHHCHLRWLLRAHRPSPTWVLHVPSACTRMHRQSSCHPSHQLCLLLLLYLSLDRSSLSLNRHHLKDLCEVHSSLCAHKYRQSTCPSMPLPWTNRSFIRQERAYAFTMPLTTAGVSIVCIPGYAIEPILYTKRKHGTCALAWQRVVAAVSSFITIGSLTLYARPCECILAKDIFTKFVFG